MLTDAAIARATRENASPARNAAASDVWERVWFSALVLLAITKLWLLPLRNGFWQDETGTFWAVQGGFAETVHRTLLWPAQTLLYTLIEWFAVRLGGSSELVMRLPSVLAMLAGAYLLYRIGLRLMGTDAARAATLVFICTEAVAFAAGDARPYALGTMAVIAATWFLIRWLDEKNVFACMAFAASASLIVHMHYVLAVSLVVFVVYGGFRMWQGDKLGVGQILTASAVFVVLLAPIVPHFQSLWHSRQSHSFAGTPGLIELFGAIIPPVVAGSLMAGLGLARLVLRGFDLRLERLAPSTLVLIGTWALLPCVLLFGVSSISSVKVFIPRYLLPAAPGLALLAGWFISAARPAWAQLVTLSVFTSVILFSTGGLFHPPHGGDWRAIMEDVKLAAGDPAMPVLVRSNFIESGSFDAQSGAAEPEYFHAPLLAYPAPGQVLRLPLRMDGETETRLEAAASTILGSSSKFLLVTSGDSIYEYWLLGRLSSSGFHIERTTYYGGRGTTLRLITFTKGKA